MTFKTLTQTHLLGACLLLSLPILGNATKVPQATKPSTTQKQHPKSASQQPPKKPSASSSVGQYTFMKDPKGIILVCNTKTGSIQRAVMNNADSPPNGSAGQYVFMEGSQVTRACNTGDGICYRATIVP